MAVAWIGNREASLAHAVDEAAVLLEASKCPVILLDTDIHGTRAAIALAEQIGAAYDVADDGSSAVEAALIMDRGAMTIAPGETRRRADLLVLVGPVPKQHLSLVSDLAGSTPDLSGDKTRKLFTIGTASKRGQPEGAVPVGSARTSLAETLAGIRASLAGKSSVGKMANLEMFVAALAAAIFPVFIYSGEAGLPVLEMLQGLVADLNRTKRASSLHLPASENGWGAVLASTWMTGFAPRTSFARGFPEFDPWRFDVRRMIAAGEADVVLTIGSAGPKGAAMANHIAITTAAKPNLNAAISIAIGTPGVDNDTVRYSARLGTIAGSNATQPSDLPSAATVLRLLDQRLRGKAVTEC